MWENRKCHRKGITSNREFVEVSVADVVLVGNDPSIALSHSERYSKNSCFVTQSFQETGIADGRVGPGGRIR